LYIYSRRVKEAARGEKTEGKKRRNKITEQQQKSQNGFLNKFVTSLEEDSIQ